LYLQHIVEHITGEPIELYAQRTLFEPIGLRHTSYVWTRELDSCLATGHDANGAFLRKSKYTNANAAYTLYTTAREYAMFLIEIMKTNRSAKHSLSKRSIDAMLKRQVRADTREPIERPGRAQASSVYWGLGWSINATKEGDIMHHSGSNRTGFRCFSQFNPRKGSGLVIMTNSSSGGDLWTRLVNLIGDQ
jgi:CubicO group peptidase (beta-lactamase class C family)